ncbi:hypothetical protein [Anaeromyxobacter dehalogenans]|uniref:Uncharacterized protein n=1 Tax=Anaeromyxobacter dehalogenans (strain 2CP-C) TaxID=290397 RepID=Q2IQV4_ANADE|nr:hypothetical protein [Anaeromyxobacter dehalogenans]ABC81187.1 hypothetical protein Adeh_1414 [Anaeromyxobacter dehalogenans 2CP-C]
MERVDAAPYILLRLETEKGQVWVAVPKAEVPKRSKVTAKNGAVLRNVEPKQSGRMLDAVVLGALE